MICDILIKNVKILTMDDHHPTANWIAVTNGKIVALGDSDDMPDAVDIYDMPGKTVIPGFIDTHVHGTLTGEFLKSVDLNTAKDKQTVMDCIASETRDFSRIITAGCFSKEGYKGEMFTARDLDEVCRDKIIFIYDKSYHGCYLNTRGLEAAGMKPGMPGVVISEGRMTGEIADDTSYYSAVREIMGSADESLIQGYMNAVNDYALSNGITTIHSLDGGDYGSDMPTWITRKNALDLHVVNYWESLDVNKVIPYGLKQVGGCICLDGTRSLRTMALFNPYNDDSATRGILYYSDTDVMNFVKKADLNGLQCSMHATGNRAIDQYIYILRQVIKENGQKDLRHRIEHFSNPTEEHIEMAAELKLALPMQPGFFKLWDDGENSMYRKRFGKDNAKTIEPIADIIRAGCIVCGGSDSPVTDINPLIGIDACVNSQNPHRRISMNEALKMYTVNGAWAAHQEKEKGTLEVGKNADMTVLDSNPIENAAGVKDISIEMTMVEGKFVYNKGI